MSRVSLLLIPDQLSALCDGPYIHTHRIQSPVTRFLFLLLFFWVGEGGEMRHPP